MWLNHSSESNANTTCQEKNKTARIIRNNSQQQKQRGKKICRQWRGNSTSPKFPLKCVKLPERENIFPAFTASHLGIPGDNTLPPPPPPPLLRRFPSFLPCPASSKLNHPSPQLCSHQAWRGSLAAAGAHLSRLALTTFGKLWNTWGCQSRLPFTWMGLPG